MNTITPHNLHESCVKIHFQGLDAYRAQLELNTRIFGEPTRCNVCISKRKEKSVRVLTYKTFTPSYPY